MPPDTERRLSDVLAHQQDEERERAVRALLMSPLLTAGSSELALVRRHAEHLREWFQREAGWNLLIERQCARLYKRPASHLDSTRGRPEFERIHYILLCLACAVLERSDSQITLKSLGERLLEAAQDPELAALNFLFTLESPRERRALVSVCRLLLEYGVLARVAGDEEAYVNQSGDVLFDIHRRVLACLPASTRGVSLLESTAQVHLSLEARLDALLEEYVPDSTDARRTATRHRLTRRLLDDPVTYYDELSEEERAYLATQRGPMSARLAQGTGLTAELRAEGLALVDRDGELSDQHMPAVGTEAHTTLLVAQHLANRTRERAERAFSMNELSAFLRSAADEFGRYWRKDAREPGAERALADQAVARLAALKLVKVVQHGEGVQALPALMRFAIGAPQVQSRTENLL